ncbi:MAG: molybdopterin-binding protein [Caldilineaceae bacterium]
MPYQPLTLFVRTAFLCVPELDDEAIAVIFGALKAHLPAAILHQSIAARNQRNWVEEILRRWCDEEEVDLVITIGGTLPAPGPSSAEIVPEATQSVVERLVPGLAEAMRFHAQRESALAWLDRGIVGIRGRSLLLNLPAGAAPALLFFTPVAELTAPLLAHLQADVAAPQLADVLVLQQDNPAAVIAEEESLRPSAQPEQRKGLDAEEFAAFLARRTKSAK